MSLEGTAENSNVPILKGKITGITVPQIDKTLSKAGQSAEAKATGEAIEKVKEDATEGVNEAKAAAAAANTAALEAKAMVENSGATVSMNAPTAEHNVQAGFKIGAMWMRPSYTLHNLAYSIEEYTASACLVAKEGQTFTATGNGDDKVISMALEHGSESGWLYCVVTPDANAVSAKVIAGNKSIDLTPGEANVVNHKFSGTGVTFEVTYETANIANGSTLVIDNLTAVDEAATLEQVEADFRDVSDNTVFAIEENSSPFSDYVVIADSWHHTKNGVWESVGIRPKIVVSAPKGSNVGCFKGDIMLHVVEQNGVSELDGVWTFDVTEFGEWTVLLNGNPRAKVMVETVKQYYVDALFEQLVNYTTLYDNGDECTEITGGWTVSKDSSVCQKNDKTLQVGITGNTSGTYAGNIHTINTIPLSEYTAYGGFVKTVTGAISTNFARMYFSPSANSYDSSIMNNTKVDGLCLFDLESTESLYMILPAIGASAFSWQTDFIYLAKHDDIETLAAHAGITATTINDILEQAAVLLANDIAVSFMCLQCTGDFMVKAVTSAVFLEALGNSPYKERVYANEQWAKFLAMVA